MARLTRSCFLRIAWLFAAMALLLPFAEAKEPSARGSLSSTTARVGEPVDYELSVEGAFDVNQAPVPSVAGLDVRGTSRGSQIFITGSEYVRRTSVTYRLVPQREGTFTIPPLEVTVDGKKLSTKPLTLTVSAAPQATEAGDFAFAEIRLGKKTPFVGEAVPIEVRLYLDNTYRWELRQQPVLSGSGFTLEPFGRFSERPVEMAGKNYSAVTWRSVITPGKAGTITIGPLPVKAAYSEQRRLGFGMLPRAGPARHLEVTAPAVTMDAQLLPSAGRPADFSGAIGNFELDGIGTPNRVNVGEPVQMVLRVTGDGNFERVTLPPLSDPDGWRVYDAEERFEATDEVGFSGTKTFTVPVAPTTRKTEMPVFSFTYFDPEKEIYQTLKTAAAPLTVTGAEPPAPATPAPAAPDSPQAPAAAPADPEATAQDILGILPERGRAWKTGLAFSTPVLAGLLLAPIPLIAALLVWRRSRGDQHARRRQELKRERAAFLQKVQMSSDPAEFYDAAAHVLQIDAALVSGKEPRAAELDDILVARKANPETQAAVEELFHARAALVYAGGGRGAEGMSSRDRDRVLETLAAYERSEPR